MAIKHQLKKRLLMADSISQNRIDMILSKLNVMKKIILFGVLGLLLVSCKKNTTGDIVATNTVTATVDNTNYVFNQNLYDDSGFDPGTEFLSITEQSDSIISGIELDVTAVDNIQMTTGTYGLSGDSTRMGDIDLYDKNTGTDYYNIDNSVTRPFTITVTSITATSIEGTFKGVAYANRDTTLTQKTIINGKFNISRY